MAKMTKTAKNVPKQQKAATLSKKWAK